MTDAAAFRRQFPVFEHTSYLNAGTEGPLPESVAAEVNERMALETSAGRSGKVYFERVMELAGELRRAYAEVLGAGEAEVALTGSTTDGVNTVIGGLGLRAGDEVLTSDEEHPGLLAPLGRARIRDGITVRVVPFARLASEVRETTRLVACSHVSWVNGQVADVDALRATGVPLLLDAAQGLGAVPVDVRALGCDFYAASGQKWLCGPEGSGCLYVRADRLDALLMPWPGYSSVAAPEKALDFEPAEGAARFDHGFPSGLRGTWALASLAVLREAGWDWVHERAASLAERLAARLSRRGVPVAPRGRSTLVSFQVADAAETVTRLAELGFTVRSIPASELVRVSVGAWNEEGELDALVEAVAGG